MVRTIEYVKNLKFVNSEKTAIDVIVKFKEFDDELPFTATSYDPMPYGVELYNRILSGEFGEIQQFDDSNRIEELSIKIRLQRNELLSSTDWSQVADISQIVRDKYIQYRQALRDVPQQEGFPENIVWPVLEN